MVLKNKIITLFFGTISVGFLTAGASYFLGSNKKERELTTQELNEKLWGKGAWEDELTFGNLLKYK